MSPERASLGRRPHPRAHLQARRLARRVLALLLAPTALGCGRGDANGGKSVGRAGADSIWRAPGAEPGAGAAEPPTPGFTSAQGTPAAHPAPATASAILAERMAPPPSAALVARVSADEQSALRSLPAGAGRDLVLGNCLICHAATMITQQHKDSAGWNKTVTQMVAWGAPVPKAQQATLVAYLAAHYGVRAAGPPARQAP